jgi:hypothetical protein
MIFYRQINTNFLHMYKVVQIWPGQTVTCLNTNSPGHIWNTLYILLPAYGLAQLIEALRYKLEGRGFDFRWNHWNFLVTTLPVALWPWGRLSLWQKWVPGILPGGKDGRCVGLTTLPPSCPDCLEIMESSLMEFQGPVQTCSRKALPYILPHF